MSEVTCKVTFKREVMDDDFAADLSWLDQTDAQMGEGFEAVATERKEGYRRGDWHMIGIRAVATVWIREGNYITNYTLESPGCFGIESDSAPEYLDEVYREECDTLRSGIEAMKLATFEEDGT